MLITFSGLDGAGKSTQIDLLKKSLAANGVQVVYLWTRGGYTPLFNGLKGLLRRISRGRALPASGRSEKRTKGFSRPWVRFLWLHVALLDLILLYGIQLRLWLASSKNVICDRYLWDTLVDFRLNFPTDPVESGPMWKFLQWVAPKPDASFLMMIPVDESLRRSEQKHEPFPDSAEVLAARREQYLGLSNQAGWRVLDGTQSMSTIASQILAGIPRKLREKVQLSS